MKIDVGFENGCQVPTINIINPDNIELKGAALQYFNGVNSGIYKINIYSNMSNEIKETMFTLDDSFIKLKIVDEHTYKVI